MKIKTYCVVYTIIGGESEIISYDNEKEMKDKFKDLLFEFKIDGKIIDADEFIDDAISSGYYRDEAENEFTLSCVISTDFFLGV